MPFALYHDANPMLMDLIHLQAVRKATESPARSATIKPSGGAAASRPAAPLSVVAGRDCPLCGGDGVAVGMRDSITLRACCGTLLAWAWESREEYEGLYSGWEYHHNEQVREGQDPQTERWEEYCLAARSRLRWLEIEGILAFWKFRPDTLLDVGASVGAMVYEATASGYQAVGIEPCAPVVRWAWLMRQVPLVCGGWEYLRGEWTVITACDVIEHLTDPAGFLQRARQHTRRLYLETPDWPGNQMPEQWEHKRHIRVRQHPCLFSEDALVELARRQGWRRMLAHRPVPGKLGVLLGRSD